MSVLLFLPKLLLHSCTVTVLVDVFVSDRELTEFTAASL